MTVFTIPGTVPAGGVTDATDQIQTFVGTVPDGGSASTPNTIRFPAGATYRVEGGLVLFQRNNLIIDLNGGSVIATTPFPFGVACAMNATNIAGSKFVTSKPHDLAGNARVKISDGCVLTSGIVQGGFYWPLRLSATQFQVSNSQGGPPIKLGSTTSLSGQITTTAGSNTATCPNNWFLAGSTSPMKGQPITGGQLAAGSTVASVTDAGHIKISPTPTHTETFTATIGLAAGNYDPRIEFVNVPGDIALAFPLSKAVDVNGNTNTVVNPYGLNRSRANITRIKCTNVTITSSSGRGTIVGASTSGVFGSYDANLEQQNGVYDIAGSDSLVEHVDISSTYGDGGGFNTTGAAPNRTWHHRGTYRDVTITGACRQGFTLAGAEDILMEDCTIHGWQRHAIDLEDDNSNVGSSETSLICRRTTFIGGAPGQLGWIAAGGTSHHHDLVIGGLVGHPEDRNVIINCAPTLDGSWPGIGPRQGPYTFGYNLGGGQITLHTNGTTTATYTALVDPTGNTAKLMLEGQPVTGGTIPASTNIMTATPATATTGTIVLSKATPSGTFTATYGVIFGSANPPAMFEFLHVDGAEAFFNQGVLQAGRGMTGSIFDNSTGIDSHDNTWINGGDSQIINAVTGPDAYGGPTVTGTKPVPGTTTGVTSTHGVGLGVQQWDGVTVTGNIIYLKNQTPTMVAVWCLDCTGVNVTGNTLNGTVFPLETDVTPGGIAGTGLLTGGDTLVASGFPTQLATSAVLIGGGTIVGSGFTTVAGTGLLDGGGSLVAAGVAFDIVDVAGTGTLDGGGDMSAVGLVLELGDGFLDGAGVLVAAGDVGAEDAVGLLDGGGDLSGSADVGAVGVFGVGVLVGGGTLTAVARSRRRHGWHIGPVRLRPPGYGKGPYGKGPYGGLN